MQDSLRSHLRSLGTVLGQATKTATNAAMEVSRAVATEVGGARCLQDYALQAQVATGGPQGLWRIYTAQAKKSGGAGCLKTYQSHISPSIPLLRSAGVCTSCSLSDSLQAGQPRKACAAVHPAHPRTPSPPAPKMPRFRWSVHGSSTSGLSRNLTRAAGGARAASPARPQRDWRPSWSNAGGMCR